MPQAVMAAPLSVAGHVHGVVCLGRYKNEGIFTSRESKLLSVLCAQAAPTFKNAAFLKRLQDSLTPPL